MITTALSAFLLVQVGGTAKLRVMHGTKQTGTATITQKLNAQGDKLVFLTFDLTSPDGKSSARLRTETTYRSDGSPTRMFHEMTYGEAKKRRQVTVSFSTAGARAVVDDSGARNVKEAPLASPALMKDLSEFWFLRDQPKVGTTISSYHFDTTALDWSMVENKYLGKQNISWNGQTISAHKVKSQRAVSYLDDLGLPLRIELEEGFMERIPEPKS